MILQPKMQKAASIEDTAAPNSCENVRERCELHRLMIVA
jgi:hypothetical protein